MLTIDPTLPKEFLDRAYDLGDWQSVELLPAGKSRHYRLTTSKGEYVVRRSYRSKSKDGIRFEHELIAHLRDNGFPAPSVVKNVRGESFTIEDGRIFAATVFVHGAHFQAGSDVQLRQVAESLARYHRLVANFRPSVKPPHAALINVSLRKRLEKIGTGEPGPGGSRDDSDRRLTELRRVLPGVIERGWSTVQKLDSLYPTLPLVIIHAGCRRGSVLFEGDKLVGVLDFDSSHLEARALDLTVALHDFAKVYGDPASSAFKVPLDLGVVSRFMEAYQSVNPLDKTEIEAIPALLAAKRVKRALGRFQRLLSGDALSEGDIKKMELETERLRWLEGYREELESALSTGI
jgi:homoserine kinase type II